MLSEKQWQKFHTDDESLARYWWSGDSDWFRSFSLVACLIRSTMYSYLGSDMHAISIVFLHSLLEQTSFHRETSSGKVKGKGTHEPKVQMAGAHNSFCSMKHA